MKFTLYYIKMTDKADPNHIFYKIGYSANLENRIKVFSRTRYNSMKIRNEYNIELLFSKEYDTESEARNAEHSVKNIFRKYIVRHELSKKEMFNKNVLEDLFTYF